MAGKPNPQKPEPSKPAAASSPAPAPKQPDARPVAKPADGSEPTYSLSRHSQVEASPAATAADQALRREAKAARRAKAEIAATAAVMERVVSLDAFRGFIMMMLAAGGFGILAFSGIDKQSPLWQTLNYETWQRIGWHFEHPEWLSVFDKWKVSFWDLIQPSFMFMVGVAMPFSDARREKQGQSKMRRALHAIGRSIVLVLIGVALYSKGNTHTNWIFPNVLCQIGLGYFFAWCLMNLRWFVQIISLVVLLGGYWAAFYFNPPPADYNYEAVNASGEEIFEGSWSAWSKNANLAYRFDAWLLPKLRLPQEPESTDPKPPESKPTAEHRIIDQAGKPILASMTQENVPPLPENGQADEKKSEPEATATPGDAIPQPESPADSQPAEPVAGQGEAATPATEPQPTDETAEAKPAEPGWIRKVFFSNPTPYKPNGGGYMTLNFVPSIGTTLLGILCGQLLMVQSMSRWAKLGILIVAAAGCLGLGVLAGETICPIVKRIWTPSWVLFSGGYVIGFLALFYLFFDIAPLKPLAFPLVVVGSNSIMIYLLGETISGWMKSDFIPRHLGGLIEITLGPKALDPQWYQSIMLATTTFLLYWLLLLWLYRQKYFLKI